MRGIGTIRDAEGLTQQSPIRLGNVGASLEVSGRGKEIINAN